MKHLNVRDLTTSMQSRQARRNQCFDKVLEQCFTFIKKHADKNKMFCFYEVPEFQLGFPLYDLNECISYIVEKLQNNEFLVRYFFPRILYVSWNVAEIKEEKLKQNMSLIKSLEGPSTSQPNYDTSASFTFPLVSKPPPRPRQPRKAPAATLAAASKARTITFQTPISPDTGQQQNSGGFVKSVKQFKPSGKIVLDL